VLGSRYKVWSKAGWYYGAESYSKDPSETSGTNDAGVVFSETGPYVLSVVTDLPIDFDRLCELVDAGKPLPAGKNVESNAVMLCAKFTLWGAEPLRFPIVKDNWSQLEKALTEASEKADIVVINAGSSKGSDDFTCEILEKNGRMLHHMLAQGPGRHCSAAMLHGTPVIGISGPPMGAEFTVDWMVKPLVDRYLGLPGDYPPMVFARMEEDPGFWPEAVQVVKRGIVWRDENDELWARVLSPEGRPNLRELDQANCFITFGRNVQSWRAGEWHAVELSWPYVI
jgi:molybdopterin molybdotransferase/putative molybdopterin biosynthesis protein